MKESKEQRQIKNELANQGFSVLQGPKKQYLEWRDLIQPTTEDFSDFHQTWEDLPADDFLRDGGHYRFRRYSVFNWFDTSELKLLPHEPHYQSTYRNNMNGGIYRDFEPFKQQTIEHPLLKSIIDMVAPLFSFQQEKFWRIQAHQFRIVASAEEPGIPTPEGIHKDGADFILIMVLKRENITGGVNHIYDASKRLAFGAVLTEPGDAILLDDNEVWHGVSEVYPVDGSKPAYRDVLVLTFHNKTNT